MEQVVVLMSTYNGEAYVEDQIESILRQTYPNISICVRDDGSSDNTIEILRKYKLNNKIELIEGKNKGFINSFFELIEKSVEGDYYAFCDQDDVWNEDKLEIAVHNLSIKRKDIPVLYFSDYDYYDQNMNFVGRCSSHKRGPSFRNSLVDCISLGISSVINKHARDMIKENRPMHCCGHDWWSYMLCSGLGEVIYDKAVTVKYRRHPNNVSAGGMGFIKFQIWRIKKFIVNDYFNDVRMQLQEYSDLYKDKLSSDKRSEMLLFTDHKLQNKIKKVFRLGFYRQKFFDEIMLRIMFLIGKL